MILTNGNNNFPQGKFSWWFDQKIILLNDHREIVENLIEQNVDLFAEKDTDLGTTSTTKMNIDTGNHPPIKLRSYRTPLPSIQW